MARRFYKVPEHLTISKSKIDTGTPVFTRGLLGKSLFLFQKCLGENMKLLEERNFKRRKCLGREYP